MKSLLQGKRKRAAMQDSPWENRQCTGKGIIMAAADIGIDLGTSSILVYTKGKRNRLKKSLP